MNNMFLVDFSNGNHIMVNAENKQEAVKEARRYFSGRIVKVTHLKKLA